MLSLLRYASDESIRNLETHKFHAGEYTPLDNALNPFWLWCQKFVPRWISPNAVSLFGGFGVALGTVIVMLGDETSTIPLCACGFCFFVYQTADAVDGKHARLTGQTTPLGALVDHCVDATLLLTSSLSIVILLGPTCSASTGITAMMVYTTAWFIAQWGDYECGMLETAGVTEAECGIIALFVAPVFFGRNMYEMALPSMELNLGDFLGIACIVGLMGKIIVLIFQVLQRSRRPMALMALLPIVAHNVAGLLLRRSSSTTGTEPLLCCAVIFMNVTVLSTKMVISVVTQTPWPAIHVETLPFMACAMWACIGGSVSRWTFIAVLAWQFVAWYALAFDTISRTCTVLNIPFIKEVPRDYRATKQTE